MANDAHRLRWAPLATAALLLLVSCASARHSVMSQVDPMQGPFELKSTRMHLAAGAACDAPCGNYYCPWACQCDFESTPTAPTPYEAPSGEGSPPLPEGGSYSPTLEEGSPPPPQGGSYSPPVEEGSPPPPKGESYSPPIEEGSPPPPQGVLSSPPTDEGPPPAPEVDFPNTPPAGQSAPSPASGFGVKLNRVTLAQEVCKTACKCYG